MSDIQEFGALDHARQHMTGRQSKIVALCPVREGDLVG
jgi:hypothetical protein